MLLIKKAIQIAVNLKQTTQRLSLHKNMINVLNKYEVHAVVTAIFSHGKLNEALLKILAYE